MATLVMAAGVAGGTTSLAGAVYYAKGVVRRLKKRHDEVRGYATNLALPLGTDLQGRRLMVEITKLGTKDAFTHAEMPHLVPVKIKHKGIEGEMEVAWGDGQCSMWALTGRTHLAEFAMRGENQSLTNVLNPFQATYQHERTAAPVAPLPASSGAGEPINVKKMEELSAKPMVPMQLPKYRKSFFSWLGFSKPGFEAHIAGSLYDPNGYLPQEKSGFCILSNNTGKTKVYWASTILTSKRRNEPFVFVLRHTLYALRQAVTRNECLHVVLDSTRAPVGIYGDQHFPVLEESQAVCLADATPSPLKEVFNEALQADALPPDEALLYDLLLVPVKWNVSKAGLKSFKASYGTALGKALSMRAFDDTVPSRNGVTMGIVPDTPENKNMIRTCGVVKHMIANNRGGSGSYAWCDGKICLMHMGCHGQNLNYGVPGPVLQQLENLWLGELPLKATDAGYKRFVQVLHDAASEADKVVDQYDPGCIGKTANDVLADKIGDAICPPGNFEAPLGKMAGSKSSLAFRHATGNRVRSMAKMDYKKARDMVRQFKVSTKPSSGTMAQLYYWLGNADDEEYDYRFSRMRDRDEELAEEALNEFEDWVREMLHGGDGPGDDAYYGTGRWEAPITAVVEEVKEAGEPPAPAAQEVIDADEADKTPAPTAPPGFGPPTAPTPEVTVGGSVASGLQHLVHGKKDVKKTIRFEQTFPGSMGEDTSKKPQLEAPIDAATPVVVVTQVCEDALESEWANCYEKGKRWYATDIKDCGAETMISPEDCLRFDFILDKLLTPEALEGLTMRQFYDAFDGLKFQGNLTGSKWFQNYIKGNILPEDHHLGGVMKINRTTPKARCQEKARGQQLREPTKTGLFESHSEWVWDDAANQAKGVWPPTGPHDIKASLDQQLKDRSACKPLDPRTVPTLASGYPAAVWDEDETVLHCVQRHLNSLAMEKGVGWHPKGGANTKKDYVKSAECVPATLVKLALFLATDYDWMAKATPWQLYQGGYIMPEILKIKTEAHSRSKADERRWRIIWQTCITQEIVTRLLHADLNVAGVSCYQADFTHSDEFPTFGNAAGMGHHDEGLNSTKDALRRLIGDRCGGAADRKGWDMSISRHLWMADGQFRALLAHAGGAPRGFQEAQLKLTLCLSAHVIQVGSVLYQVDVLGIVGSGILSTAASNGEMNQLAEIDYPISKLQKELTVEASDFEDYLSLVMGDDSVTRGAPDNVEDYVEHHAGLGIKVTGANKGEPPGPLQSLSEVPFTSHIYDLDTEGGPGGVFDNVEKLALRLALTNKVDRDQANGIMFAVRHSPHRGVVQEMIGIVNPDLANHEYEDGAAVSLETFL